MSRTLAREVVSGGLTALPPVNSCLSVSPVTVSSGATGPALEAPTRVEDLLVQVGDRRSPSSAELIIAQPEFAGDPESVYVGAEYVLRWLNERGVHEVVGRFLGRRRVGPVLIGWRMGITGPVTRIQRRAHARVAVSVPVEVLPLSADGEVDESAAAPAGWTGLTVDVSEGGVLAALRPAAPVAAPAVGSDVEVRFVLSGEPFVLAGRVVRRQTTSTIAVAFDSPNVHGDRIRPLLFAHQLKARRIGVL